MGGHKVKAISYATDMGGNEDIHMPFLQISFLWIIHKQGVTDHNIKGCNTPVTKRCDLQKISIYTIMYIDVKRNAGFFFNPYPH